MNWLDNLRELKNTTSETYKSISEKTEIPQTTIEKLFNGRTKEPKLFMVRDVIHCLGYTLDDLLDENHNEFKITDKYEKSLIENYRNLSEQGKEYILQTMELVKDKYKKENDAEPQFEKEQNYKMVAWGGDNKDSEAPKEPIIT